MRQSLGLSTVATFAVGLLSAGPALTAQAFAADSQASAFIANRTLNIIGTNGPDDVFLSPEATTVEVAFGANATNVQSFNLADFDAISVSLGNGDGQFMEQRGDLAGKTLTVDGGNGNDTITTGDGNDTIDHLVVNNDGSDKVSVLGSGVDLALGQA